MNRNIQNQNNKPKSKDQVSVTMHQSYSGPIPPAQELAKYEEIFPGATQIIFDMAKSNQDYYQKENTAVRRDNSNKAYLGQLLAFLSVIAILVAVYLLAINGREFAAALIGAGGLVGVITAFRKG